MIELCVMYKDNIFNACASPLSIIGVSKTYAKGSVSQYCALCGVSYEFKASGIYGLIGPNGAGKTTLLRIISNVIKPDSGEILIFGVPVKNNAAAAKGRIGFLSATTGLYSRLSPRETLFYFGRLFDLSEGKITRRVSELSELFEMRDFIDKKNETLSFGQRQRVNIARCLLHEPDIFVFDEITEGLDVMSSRIVIRLIKYLAEIKKCVIFSTHDMNLAEKLCENLIILHKGNIIESGRINELKYKHSKFSCSLEDIFINLIGAQESCANLQEC